MNDKVTRAVDRTETLLRQHAPPLPVCSALRVAKICIAMEALPPPCSGRIHLLSRTTLFKVAAVWILAAGAVLMLRLTSRPPTDAFTRLGDLPFLAELRAMSDPSHMESALTAESDNLVADLITLSTVLNERSLAILF